VELRFLESYGSVVVASPSMGVPLVSFGVEHPVIPFPDMEQEAGGH
jgi:hypothetical protein